jgi:hypothetical protein
MCGDMFSERLLKGHGAHALPDSSTCGRAAAGTSVFLRIPFTADREHPEAGTEAAMTAHVHLPHHLHVPAVRLPGSRAMAAPMAPVVALLLIIAVAAMIVITLVAITSVASTWILAPGPHPVPYPAPYPVREGGVL